jgi:hypothetical protein
VQGTPPVFWVENTFLFALRGDRNAQKKNVVARISHADVAVRRIVR